jgi:sulfur-oxidizing protein SoxZ
MTERQIRLRVPKQVRRGEVFEIKTLIAHEMESGLRRDAEGERIPEHIIERFECTFNGRLVFGADLNTGVSANPYITFFARVDGAGTFDFRWFDQDGSVYHAAADIAVA